MSSGKEKLSVVFLKTGVSWQKWQWAEDCSTRARLQLRMPGRRWYVVWFAVRCAFDGRQIVVAEVLPTHQSSVNHWRDTEAQVMSTTVNLYGQSKLNAFRDLQPVQVSKQMCDVIILPWLINKIRRGIHHGLQAVHQVSGNVLQDTLRRSQVSTVMGKS